MTSAAAKNALRRARPAIAAALMGASVLAACGSREPPPPCPTAVIVTDLASVTRFRDGPGRDVLDIRSQGEIFDVLVQCDYNRSGATVDLQVAIRAARGPADTERRTEFAYFVAIESPDGAIVAKEQFTATYEFRDNRTTVGSVEELVPVIPGATRQTGARYRLLIGFQLTPEEIAWNQRQRPR
ncbi:MAG TPA: hypothetical protein VJ924_07385 [Alphaproteobacteria bacterium]|nr:hypothetical protein [Alphaproteobacteria bacterium]